MLLIFVNDQSLELNKFSLNFILKSCIEIDRGIPGSYVFNFAVPATSRNNSIFKYPHRLTKADLSPKEFPCTIVSFGKSRTGILTVESANPKLIELSVSLDAGPYNQLIGETMLPDIFSQEIYIGPTTQDVIDHCNSVASLYYPDTDYVFPSVFNDYLYGDPNDEDVVISNYDFQNIINLYENGTYVQNAVVPDGASNLNSLIPYFFVSFLVKHCFNHYGYSIEGRIFQHPEYSQLLLGNNWTLDKIEERYSYVGLVDSYGFAGMNQYQKMFFTDTITEYDNVWDNANAVFDVLEVGFYEIFMRFDIKGFDVPSGELWVMVRLIYDGEELWFRLRKFTNTLIYNTFDEYFSFTAEAADVGKTIYAEIWVENEINYPDFNIINGEFSIRNTSQSNLNRFQKTVKYKNHMPNVLISEFLQSFFQLTATFPVFDHNLKTCKLVYISDAISSFPPVPFSDNILPHSLKSTVNDYDGITFSYDFTESDEFYSKMPDALPELYRTVSSYLQMPYAAPEASIIYVESLNKYFKLTHKQYPDGTTYWEWDYLADDLEPHILDNGSRNITFKMAPLTMFYSELYQLNIPAIRAVGNSISFNTKPNETGLRITFWRGMTDSESSDYPMAGSYKVGSFNTKFYNYDLRLEDPDGPLNTFWLPVIEWYRTRIPIELKKQLTQSDLHKLVFDSVFRVGEINLVFDQISFKLSKDSLGQANIKGWHL